MDRYRSKAARNNPRLPQLWKREATMCRVDDCDERALIIAEERLKAKKPHPCYECRRIIGVGEFYCRERGKFDGRMFTHKTCEHCGVASEWMNATCGGYVYGQIEEELREHWDEDTAYRTRELARLIWGMGRFWRTRKGALMPVPTLNR
jgi:hypothetical protein